MRTPLVCGNWKMNGSRAANAALVRGLRDAGETPAEMAVCPPFVYLEQVRELLAGSRIALGAQDGRAEPAGAFTGDVSFAMLADIGVDYAIIGHSERRAMHGETDADIATRFVALLDAGLRPIVCVGETLDEREAGKTQDVVRRQIDTVLGAADGRDISRAVVAYEPVWAIGTGRTATPEMAQDVHAFIRARLGQYNADAGNAVRVVYGGSMKPQNAAALMAMADVDGGLIGGASLAADDFIAIARAAPGSQDS